MRESGAVKVTKADLQRYAENYLKEQDGIALYRSMASAEKDPERAQVFSKLARADVDERHAAKWANLLKAERGLGSRIHPRFQSAFVGVVFTPIRHSTCLAGGEWSGITRSERIRRAGLKPAACLPRNVATAEL